MVAFWSKKGLFCGNGFPAEHSLNFAVVLRSIAFEKVDPSSSCQVKHRRKAGLGEGQQLKRIQRLVLHRKIPKYSLSQLEMTGLHVMELNPQYRL